MLYSTFPDPVKRGGSHCGKGGARGRSWREELEGGAGGRSWREELEGGAEGRSWPHKTTQQVPCKISTHFWLAHTPG